MKKLWLILTILTIVSCKEQPKINYAIISGTISNVDSETLLLYRKADMVDFKKTSIAKDGKFNDTIQLDASSLFVLRQNKNRTNLHLAKGDVIVVNYDAKDYKNTLSITGKGANESNYLIKKAIKLDTILGEQAEVYRKEEVAFKTTFLEAKEAGSNLLTNYKGLSEEFKANEIKNINYSYLGSLNKYKRYHSFYAKKKDFKTSEGFLNELDSLDYTNEDDFVFSSSYYKLVASKYRKDADLLAEKDSIDADLAMIKVSNKITNSTIKNSLLYNTAKYGITYTDDLEGFYKIYLKGSTDKKNNEEITKSYIALKKLSEGSVSPKFSKYENNAGGVTSLDDFKGKYVYIDVWATWCGPCIREIPSLKKIEKKYHDKNIEFVSISIDVKKDHDKWKKMIVSKELSGIQLMADNDWKSEFVENYLIKEIPRFILIDPQGNIVNSNAERPSSKKLIELFDSLKL